MHMLDMDSDLRPLLDNTIGVGENSLQFVEDEPLGGGEDSIPLDPSGFTGGLLCFSTVQPLTQDGWSQWASVLRQKYPALPSLRLIACMAGGGVKVHILIL